MLIVFRFDASSAIGGGHAIRCAALAAELSRQGHRCGFAANEAGADLAAAILSHADILRLSGESNERDVMKKRWPDGADWLVVDHYGRDASFEQSFRGWSRKMLAVDDLPTRPHASDMLVDQTLDRTEAEYRPLVNIDCKIMAGSNYTLMREEFRAHRAAALARRNIVPQSPQIVISFGASDPGKATLRTLAALSRVRHLGHIEILVGRLCPHLGEIEAAVESDPRSSLIVDPASVASHFVNADIAIGAPGMTAWERACLGLPSIVIPVADNQVDNADALQRNGIATVLPIVERVTQDEIETAILALLDEPARWLAMSAAAARLVDGQGVMRVSAAMAAV